jgi:hypothetical protein
MRNESWQSKAESSQYAHVLEALFVLFIGVPMDLCEFSYYMAVWPDSTHGMCSHAKIKNQTSTNQNQTLKTNNNIKSSNPKSKKARIQNPQIQDSKN